MMDTVQMREESKRDKRCDLRRQQKMERCGSTATVTCNGNRATHTHLKPSHKSLWASS